MDSVLTSSACVCVCVCPSLELDRAQRLEERERILREIWMNGQPDISTVTQSLNRYYWHTVRQADGQEDMSTDRLAGDRKVNKQINGGRNRGSAQKCRLRCNRDTWRHSSVWIRPPLAEQDGWAATAKSSNIRQPEVFAKRISSSKNPSSKDTSGEISTGILHLNFFKRCFQRNV